VNKHRAAEPDRVPTLKIDDGPERLQVDRVRAFRARRDAAAARAALHAVAQTCRTEDGNVMDAVLAAVRANVTLGEVCQVFRDVWGEYRDPAHV
jgi:methylmalonyl-CoA mutase N-terminal domain/subunit